MMKYQYQASKANNGTKAVNINQAAPDVTQNVLSALDLSADSGNQGINYGSVASMGNNDYLAMLLQALMNR